MARLFSSFVAVVADQRTLTRPVIENTEAHAIITEELRLLARVTSTLSELSSQVVGAPDFNEALLNLRDQIAEAKPEDIGPLVEQMMRISAIAQRYGRGRDLPINPESPYFAHMRLREEERRRDVLIGKRGFIDRQRQVQIVDWRNAPVSRIYYRYEEGDDYEEELGGGTLEGVIEVRRSLTIDEGKLKRIGAPQGTFMENGDGRWYEAEPTPTSELSGGQGTASRPPAVVRGRKGSRLGVHSGRTLRADKHLPEIAALIDPTQFELITRPESGLVVLQGGAGSGKTTVALHRVAYLNFKLPGRFRADRIQVVVLTEAMVRYVERVLPSLGVKGVPVTTAEAWLRRTRRRVVRSPAFNRYNDDTPAVVLRFKKHPMLLTVLAEHVERQLFAQDLALREALAGVPAVDRDAVLKRWEEHADLSPVRRCARLRGWLKAPDAPLSAVAVQRAQTVTREMLRRLKDVTSDWAEVLTDRALLERAVERLCPGEFTARQIEEVCSWCARQSDTLPDPARGPERRGGREHEDSGSNPYISLDGRDERDVPVAGKLDPPDDALLLLLAALKHGALAPPGGKPIQVEHLVVDEAQDLSAIELKVLLASVGKLGSVTLAGDVSQRLAFDNAFTDWESLLERLGAPVAANTTLRLGYRSTEQIMALARSVIASGGAKGDGDGGYEWKPQRGGAAVELHRFGDQGEAVAMLAEALRGLMLREPLASVACIARYPEQARSYASALTRAEVPGVRLVANQEFSFKPGIEVTDVTQVKGLEFDYVVLLDVTAANYPDTQESRHMLYIGATRSAHQLWLISPGRPSTLLPARL